MNLLLLQLDEALNLDALRENAEDASLYQQLQEVTWSDVLEYLPILGVGILLLAIFYLLSRFLGYRMTKFLRTKTKAKNVLVANFFGAVVQVTIFSFGIYIALLILGLGRVSSWVIGAAGISTFVVGFALRDIFENFLAGMIIAFDPPFVLGSWVKVSDIQGTVVEMSLRQTHLKTFDGKDVFVPNALILKNPLFNYTIDGFLRKEFVIGLDYEDDLQSALDLIEQSLANLPDVLTMEGRKPIAMISEFGSSAVQVKCMYWINTENSSQPANKIMDKAMLTVLKVLSEDGHYLPGDILEIKQYDPNTKGVKNRPENKK